MTVQKGLLLGTGMGLTMALVLWNAPGCGYNPFLGLEDYQRDLLIGGLAGALLADHIRNEDQGAGRPTGALDGVNCWDLNGNLVNDLHEDRNADGLFDARDCQGPAGSAGQSGADGAAGSEGLAGQPGQDGTDGLACWDLNGNSASDPDEDRNGDGRFDALDCQGPRGRAGPAGSQGSPGSDAPELFDLFIDDFFAAGQPASPGLPIVLVSIDEPALGQVSDPSSGGDAVAFRAVIPQTYDTMNDIGLRFFLYRTGERESDCFVFSIDARRLRAGASIAVYDYQPKSTPESCATFPNSPNCGTRWVAVRSGSLETDTLLVVDLPLNNDPRRSGLGYPADVLAGDLLAFELRTFRADGRSYQILGVEMFEAPPGTTVLRGASVFHTPDTMICPAEDCNENGVPDDAEMAHCPAEDTSCQDCNGNAMLDACDFCEGAEARLASTDVPPSNPFAFLHNGFTQELYATAPGFMGGVAFAPDGDVLVDRCPAARIGSALRRFDAQQIVLVRGTMVHPLIAELPSNAGCGLTNHPNGTLYSNTSEGVTQLDADTGAELGGPFGPAGNSLGIAPDPQTGNLVYMGTDGTIFFVHADFSAWGLFSSAVTGKFIDGIAFEPAGEFLFLANRTDKALTMIRRSGTLVRHVPIFHGGRAREPDGVAVHSASPVFVVTTNLDGSISRFDFPDEDFTAVPTQRLFADGGFRGDLLQVGPDNCLYLTQEMTRFADGTVSTDNSVVRICSGFHPPAPSAVRLEPVRAMNFIGAAHALTATVVTQTDEPAAGVTVLFEVLPGGPNEGTAGAAVTGADGKATFSYDGAGGVGQDRIQARFEGLHGARYSNIVTMTWLPTDCSLDCNGNGIPDECDIAAGRSDDCQPDGIPDECGGACE